MPKRERYNHEYTFPIAGLILLVIGIVWFLNDLNILSINIPWIPLVLVVIAIGLIAKRCCRRR